MHASIVKAVTLTWPPEPTSQNAIYSVQKYVPLLLDALVQVSEWKVERSVLAA